MKFLGINFGADCCRPQPSPARNKDLMKVAVKLLMKSSELTAAVLKLNDKAEKIAADAAAFVALLKSEDPDLSPEAQAALEKLDGTLTKFDDEIPERPA